MKLEQSFDVTAPIDQVWQALIDVEHVAPCLPGAAVTGRNDDGSYDGTFTVKIGPTTASYGGKLEMESIDAATHTATMQANGTDKRGQGGAKATIVSTLTPLESGGTRVAVDTDYHITGRLARFGRGGMIEDISARLLREFGARLQESLAEPGDGASAEPPAAEAAAEPPAAETPAEPPADGASAEPPADGASAEPPSAETTAEPPAAETPAEPPAAETREEPPPPPAPTEPLDAGAMVTSVALDRLRSNPAPLAFVIGVLLALVLLRRRRRGRAVG